MYRVLCFEYRVCTTDYFLNELQQWELNTIVENIQYLDKNEREIDRYKLYVSIQSNSKKKLKPEDILKLPWDSNSDNEWSEEYKEELTKRRKETEERMSQIIKNMNI